MVILQIVMAHQMVTLIKGQHLQLAGKSYTITFDIVSISQGEFFFKFGGVNGTFRNSIGTYTRNNTSNI